MQLACGSTSSMRDYLGQLLARGRPRLHQHATAFGVFAHQTISQGEPPRSYLERVYNIQRWIVFPRGGHFAPVEQPAAVAKDIKAFFLGGS